ncbi:MAG: Holliday junction branch migration protein RuvA [Candidatus Azambacteria bacterium]|nr:Holliday junction branch migration protein RuvA [Candidatus Azambacteria bacterium]
MISYLEGKAIAKNEKSVIILVNGVGYKVFFSGGDLNTISLEGDTVKAFTHLQVKEDALELYGFLERAALELFELLITISGIGPKVALAILSTESPSVLAGAIAREDVKFLTKISGVGHKSAQKIMIELHEKIGKVSFEIHDAGASMDADAIDALVALGWSARDAREVLKNIPKEIEQTDLRIREALKVLGR